MKLQSRLFASRKIILGAISFLSIASIATAVPYANANPFERSVFGDDWGVLSNDLFFGGAYTMFGLSPARAVVRFADAAEKNAITSQGEAITAADIFNVSLFNSISGFYRPAGSPKTFTPNAPAVLSTIVWDGGAGGGTAWLTAANWTGDVVPDGTDVAQFASAGTATTIGISMGSPTNNGLNNQAVGAIELVSTRNRTIGNSSVTSGTLTLNGATVNAVTNVVLRNSSTFTLTLQNSGGGTGAMDVALNNPTNNIVNIDSTGGITISSVIKNGTLAPGANLTLNAPSTGALTFSGIAANTYSGLTAVNTGTLILTKTAGVNAIAGDIKIGNDTAGGTATARLGASNQFANTSDVELAGGTLNLNGFSEGAAGTTGIGALTLTTTSTIDFGAGATSIIQFAGLGTHTAGQVLQITNWDGIPVDGGSGDRLLFAGTSGAFSALYDQSEVSFNGILGYVPVDFGTYYEITAVPEPSTWIGGALALAALGFTQRRRLSRLVRKAA